MRLKLAGDLKVTPAQVRRYVKELPEDSLPFIPTQLEVQILVRKPVVAPAEIERVKNELRDYTERVNSGQSQFSTLALLHSENRETGARGGEWGFTGRRLLTPEFASVAFNLTDPKTVSKIVEDEYGFHIIQLIEKRGDRVNVRHILRKPRVSDAELTACLNQMDSILAYVTDNKCTFEEAVTNYGIMVNKNEESSLYGTPRFEMKDLPTEVARAVANLKTGETSKAFVMVDKNGKEVVAVVKLRNRVNGHRATMRDDYQALQNALLDKLGEEKTDEWIRRMQKTTYIRINEDWKNCEFRYPGWVK